MLRFRMCRKLKARLKNWTVLIASHLPRLLCLGFFFSFFFFLIQLFSFFFNPAFSSCEMVLCSEDHYWLYHSQALQTVTSRVPFVEGISRVPDQSGTSQA